MWISINSYELAVQCQNNVPFDCPDCRYCTKKEGSKTMLKTLDILRKLYEKINLNPEPF